VAGAVRDYCYDLHPISASSWAMYSPTKFDISMFVERSDFLYADISVRTIVPSFRSSSPHTFAEANVHGTTGF